MAHNKPRILLYSHDTYGLGHLRRSLSVARQLAKDIPGAHQLLITGSMVAGAFGLPPRTDMVKLPSLSKRSGGRYKPRALPLSLGRTLAWREQMILQTAINFGPDLLLVDKSAGGVHGELLPALRHLKTWSPQTKIVLGMRDIEDGPEATRAEWARHGVPRLLDQVYDLILYYGQRRLFDPVEAYRMSPVAAGKVVECGYLRRAPSGRSPQAIRRELDIGAMPLVLVTVGGGGDGYKILKTYLDMPGQRGAETGYHTVLVTGPLMPQRQKDALRRAGQGKPVTLLEFTPELTSYMAAADLVVSMAGYNTVCEILSLQKRAILIPRAQVREEQRLRATALARLGRVRLLLPDEMTPASLGQAVERALDMALPADSFDLDGLSKASAAVANLLEESKSDVRPVQRALNGRHLEEVTIA